MNLGPRKTNQGRCSPLAGLAHGLWAGPGHGIRAMGDGIRAMGDGIRAMGDGIRAMGDGIRAMGDGIRAAPATSRLRRQKH